MTQTQYQIIFMTAPGPDDADRIATTLVEERLAACVNVLSSCRSIYRWMGEMVKDDEVLMLAKAKRRDFEKIAQRVKELHSYDVPEVIAVDLGSISESYRSFLVDVLGGEPR
jgi:periplasmic divalent cation tolerance protein